ncbi:MAG: Uncharacterized protein XD50_1341 [Clostridia bacterium 41_269]|nr:MAG: Uncharacterized protein XD50_1341 [Clostridia bacterium 41_269]
MIFYTLIPTELLLFDDMVKPNFKEIKMGEASLVVEDQGDGTVKVVRLISSNPQDYLDDKFKPGTVMNYTLIFENQTS